MDKKVNKIILLILVFFGTSFLMTSFNLSSTSATNTTFEVNVKEVLSVSVTTPSTWASGDVGDFLRNIISIDVVSNNANGFTAGMTTKTENTALTNTILPDSTIPTLTSTPTCTNANCPAFPANYWGYSLNDNVNTGTYKAVKGAEAAPDTILSSNTATTGHKDIYFGARANMNQASGVYNNTVIISVVSSTNGTDITDPINTADTENPVPNTATHNEATTGNTTYTYVTNSSKTTTTQVTEGDNVDIYTGYTPPQGVLNSNSSNIYTGSLITTTLAITASIAASAGIFFFILAKRKKDDEDDQEQIE